MVIREQTGETENPAYSETLSQNDKKKVFAFIYVCLNSFVQRVIWEGTAYGASLVEV